MSGLKHLLWKRCKTVFIVAAIEVIIVVIPFGISAAATYPYLGGYFTSSALDVHHVIFNSVPYYIPPGKIPSGDYIGGVLSVAGVNDGSLSGWMYQTASSRLGTGPLVWVAESWDMANRKFHYQKTLSTEAANWGAIFLRMDMTTSCRARCWGDKEGDNVLEYYDECYPTMNPGEDHFRVGTKTYSGWSGYVFKHLQFGVESLNRVTGYNWEYFEGRVGYYDGSKWKYMPAKAVHYNYSYITWRGSYYLSPGSSNYDGVNKSYSSSDMVKWKFTNSTIANDASLWASSGDVATYPPEPFQI